MNNKVPLEDIIATIQEWKLQASSGHNDGWVIQSYKKDLQKLQEHLEPRKEPQVIT
tara:strand:+ start:1656 stop:1823 length:168 start_codon:yes stop_codon:yes gene_type:complete